MDPRPKVLLTDGRVQQPIQIQNSDAALTTYQTFLSNDTALGATTLIAENVDGLDANQPVSNFLILGQVGTGSAEVVEISSYSGVTTIHLSSGTAYPHSASTPITALPYNQVEISWAPTISGVKVILAVVDLQFQDLNTLYADYPNGETTGFYFARFYNNDLDTFSSYSDPAPILGYTIYSARSIIDSALGELNKQTSDVLSDQFAFQMLDSFQTDVLKELKRWSFMQKFDYIMGQFHVGQWKIAMPSDIEDPNTNQSVYNIRVGSNGRLTWIDKAKWDDFIFNLAYSTLSVDLLMGATTMTLEDSGDFNHLTDDNTDGSGTVIIGNNTYTYSANDTATGILTLSTVITSANTATAGQDVFQNANLGLPTYYTIFGGYAYTWPITSDQYDGVNAFMDYYTAQIRIQHDSDQIVVPDAVAASLYLQWKFLKKLNNGDEDAGSLAVMQQYLARREKLKTKKVLNRTFKFNPRFQNFAIQEQSNSGDPRFIRDGEFPNTGF